MAARKRSGRKIRLLKKIKEMYTFTFEKHNVWGASARMLKQINTLLSKKNLL